MSRLVNAGTLLGGASGAVAAAVAVWQLMQPSPIDNADDVVAALNGIRDAIDGGRVDLSAPEVQARVAGAAQPVAGLLARNLNALSSEEISALGGIAEARPGETVELRLPDGGLIRATLVSWNSFPPNANIGFAGDSYPARPGWQVDVGTGDCSVSYIGPTRDDPPAALFQLACP
ncbi:hypothetical protein [Jannaschia sp. CCS1]|uniref:hypothetical protein n=1 Tax=Jannaschia sp. (strain CCS1) TaxID=290400 RepID=UPI000053B439|nr:hypothetical protein [Jannaschia sp. CCS1]ABD53729.1 hypothetical protein Jann_0812 [Jannaschia sp. CCS1]